MDEFFEPHTPGLPGLRLVIFLRRRKWVIPAILSVFLVAFIGWIAAGLAPAAGKGEAVANVTVQIAPHESFSNIVSALAENHLLRSRLTFEIAAVLSGVAFHVPSGTYVLSPAMSVSAILRELSRGAPTVTVTIPEGSNIYEIDRTLANAGVIARGDLVNFASDGDLEGKLFPDTYQFFEGSDATSVVQKFLNNFNDKAAPLLAADPAHAEENLTLASLVQEEAPDPRDESIIAGIIKKRLAAGMRLQIDATVCYAKQITLPSEVVDCAGLTHGDFTATSPYRSAYNTYLFSSLPPGPIDNPGIVAIAAALHPISSAYWYYLSDPATGNIIYAATLAGQEANIKKYLRG